jgi:hypothetical protein
MSSRAYEHLKVNRRGALLDVTLNRPKKLNALNLEMVRELQSAFDAAEASQGCVALALRGEGERAFCAGGDIVAVRAAGLEDKPTTPFFREEYALNARTGALRESRVVQCSFWDGFTFGGGVGLSVHGKYRIATEKTQLAMFAAVHKSSSTPSTCTRRWLICTQARGRHRPVPRCGRLSGARLLPGPSRRVRGPDGRALGRGGRRRTGDGDALRRVVVDR